MSAVLLVQLREMPEFTKVLQFLNAKRPVVPIYRPAATIEAQTLQMERIKYQMAMQEGFDLLMAQLNGKPFNNGDN